MQAKKAIMQISSYWSVNTDRFNSLLSLAEGIEIESFFGYSEESGIPKTGLNVVNGVAKINIHGYLMQTVPYWWKIFGVNATGTDEVMSLVAEAISRRDVTKIVFDINSPGGTTVGSIQLADFISKNRGSSKQMVSEVYGECCSAALWIASQTNNIKATRDSSIGSIGVYTVLYDDSKDFEEMGIKAYLVTTGKNKGFGSPGTEIKPENIEMIQNVIDSYGEMFIQSIMLGRKLSREKVEELADGSFWLAEEAKEKGLINNILEATKMEVKDQSSGVVSQSVTESPVSSTVDYKSENAKLLAKIQEMEENDKKKEQAA